MFLFKNKEQNSYKHGFEKVAVNILLAAGTRREGRSVSHHERYARDPFLVHLSIASSCTDATPALLSKFRINFLTNNDLILWLKVELSELKLKKFEECLNIFN